MDDYRGPPEGHRAPVRPHDRYRWLGSCREFTHVLPDEQACPLRRPGVRAGLDARHVTGESSLFLALGEAVDGPGGSFGGCVAALADCLRGNVGYAAPATLLCGTARPRASTCPTS